MKLWTFYLKYELHMRRFFGLYSALIMEYFHYDKTAMEETNASFALRINDRCRGGGAAREYHGGSSYNRHGASAKQHRENLVAS